MTSVADSPAAIAAKAMERLDQRDLTGVVEHAAVDCVWYGFGPEPLDTTGYLGAIQAFLDAFGDSRFPVDAVVSEGDVVAVQHRLVGTHTGDFQGTAATGRSVTVPAVAVFRLTGGQITEVSLHADILGLLMQIGAIPAPGGSGAG